MNKASHELALDYFIAGVEASDNRDIERAGALLEIALQMANTADVESSGNRELDVLVKSVIDIITVSRELMATNPDSAAVFASTYLPNLVDRIFEYWGAEV